MITFMASTATLIIGLLIGWYAGYRKGEIQGLGQGLDIVKEYHESNPIPRWENE